MKNKTLVVNAVFKGNDERINKGEIYHLEIRNAGAEIGKSSGNHDIVDIPLLGISYPYTLRGFLQNWEITEQFHDV